MLYWDDFVDETQCDDLWNCFQYYITYGLRMGGGIGEVMTTGQAGSGKFMGRLLFDVVFFILINVLMLNLIQGIIIDSFGELRNEHWNREYNAKNVCFVCGLTRSDFDRKGKNFKEHIERHHYPWKYLDFIMYLTKADSMEKSSVEFDIFTCFQNRDASWIPPQITLGLGIFFLSN